MMTTEPTQFIRGNTVEWLKSLPAYSPNDGWVLVYHFATPTRKQSVTASNNGDGRFLISISSTISQAFLPGTWQWQANVTDGTALFTVASGSVEVQQGLALASGGHDGRTFAQKMLDQIETAMLESDGQETTISAEGVSMTFESKADLIVARDRFLRERKRELEQQRLNNDQPIKSLRVRF